MPNVSHSSCERNGRKMDLLLHEEFELFGYSIPDSVNNDEVRRSRSFVFVNFLNWGDRGRPSTSQIRCGSPSEQTHRLRTNCGKSKVRRNKCGIVAQCI